jgi:putative hydrolase of the HAD superfamily
MSAQSPAGASSFPAPRGRFRALLLDALGTLVELPPPAPALREELAARFGVEVSLEAAERAIAAEITYYRARFDEAVDLDALAALRRACAEVLRGALPASSALAAARVEDLVEALLGALRFRAYADAVPAILDARERGLRVVVASNWDAGLSEVLERVGLAPLLDGVVTSAIVFTAALRIAGVPPDAALHVGDSVAEDVAGARAAGLSAALIARREPAGSLGGDLARDISVEAGGVPVLRSLSQLRALI